ncbi:hypothetical protein BDV93DRAFT_507926 [Ceratobasidium sp. AG-I]|nr:hypothetical protein BDV93DRAFT_507926 [Ceratobasidium sp. AG-I]
MFTWGNHMPVLHYQQMQESYFNHLVTGQRMKGQTVQPHQLLEEPVHPPSNPELQATGNYPQSASDEENESTATKDINSKYTQEKNKEDSWINQDGEDFGARIEKTPQGTNLNQADLGGWAKATQSAVQYMQGVSAPQQTSLGQEEQKGDKGMPTCTKGDETKVSLSCMVGQYTKNRFRAKWLGAIQDWKHQQKTTRQITRR